MLGTSKILTVSYGTFSCTLEGFEDPFATMRSIAEYFRDLAAGDRYFGAEPPTPDAAMLQQIAEREIHRRVDARINDAGVTLRARETATPTLAASETSEKPAPSPQEEQKETAGAVRAAGGRADAAPPPQTGYAWPDALDDTRPVARPDSEPDSGHDVDSVTEKLERIRRVVARGTPSAAAPAAKTQGASGPGTLIEGSGFEEEDADLAPLARLPQSGVSDSVAEPTPEVATVKPDIGEDAHADSTAPSAPGDEAASTVEPMPASKAKAASEADGDAVSPGSKADAGSEAVAPFVLASPLTDKIAPEAGAAIAKDGNLSAEQPAAIPAPATTDEAAPGRTGAEGADTPDASTAETGPGAGKRTADGKPTPDAPAQGESAQGEASPPEESFSQKTREAARRARDRIRQVSGSPKTAEGAAGTTPEAATPAAKTATQGPARGQRLRKTAPDLDDVALGRLLAEANLKIDVESARERRSNITHLKAAVVATEAARQLGDTESEDDSMIVERFQDDLAQAMRPSPASGGRARVEFSTPLVLVSEQRIDRPAPTERPIIQPRRISKGNLALEEYDDDEIGEDNIAREAVKENAAPAEKAGGFARFAQEKGAHELPDLLEAAAAYLSQVEGKSPFSRPQLMRKVIGLGERGDAFTREAGLRSFGLLLRQGRLRKVASGQFSLAETSRFLPEGEADGEKSAS